MSHPHADCFLAWALDADKRPFQVDLNSERGRKTFEAMRLRERFLARDYVRVEGFASQFAVSTVFLPMQPLDEQDTELFDTMVFEVLPNGVLDKEMCFDVEGADSPPHCWFDQVRYQTYAQAMEGHAKALAAVRAGRLRYPEPC